MGANEEAITRWPDSVENLIPFSSLSKFSRIGLGGFGCVYKARLKGHKRLVAVKVLAVNRPNVTAMFVQEAAVLRMVEHENIVQFIGVVNIPKGTRCIAESIDGPKLAFVEEYLEGGTLQNLLMQQMISPFRKVYSFELALDFILGIGHALKYLHEFWPLVLHRDLTPDNIVVTRREGKLVAKLIDFGLTMLIDDKGKPVHRLSTMFLTNDTAAMKRSFEYAQPPGTPDENDTKNRDQEKQTSLPGSGDSYDIAAGETEGGQNGDHDDDDDNDDANDDDENRCMEVMRKSDRLIKFEDSKKRLSLSTSIQKYNLTGQTGSYMYMAPEVYSSMPYNESADVFSFGVIMWEVFSRNLLVVSETGMQSPQESKMYADRVANGYRPKMPESVPREVRDLVEECTDADSNRRPRFSEVVKRLNDLREVSEMRTPVGAVSCCRCM